MRDVSPQVLQQLSCPIIGIDDARSGALLVLLPLKAAP